MLAYTADCAQHCGGQSMFDLRLHTVMPASYNLDTCSEMRPLDTARAESWKPHIYPHVHTHGHTHGYKSI